MRSGRERGELRLVVAAAVVDDLTRPSRLLVARRTAPARLAGLWELPGGKVEPGESPQHGLHRELAEELGIAVELGPEALGPDHGRWSLGPDYTMRWWWAQITSGDPAPLQDHDRVRWVDRQAVSRRDWLPSNRAIVAHLIASLHS